MAATPVASRSSSTAPTGRAGVGLEAAHHWRRPPDRQDLGHRLVGQPLPGDAGVVAGEDGDDGVSAVALAEGDPAAAVDAKGSGGGGSRAAAPAWVGWAGARAGACGRCRRPGGRRRRRARLLGPAGLGAQSHAHCSGAGQHLPEGGGGVGGTAGPPGVEGAAQEPVGTAPGAPGPATAGRATNSPSPSRAADAGQATVTVALRTATRPSIGRAAPPQVGQLVGDRGQGLEHARGALGVRSRPAPHLARRATRPPRVSPPPVRARARNGWARGHRRRRSRPRPSALASHAAPRGGTPPGVGAAPASGPRRPASGRLPASSPAASIAAVNCSDAVRNRSAVARSTWIADGVVVIAAAGATPSRSATSIP